MALKPGAYTAPLPLELREAIGEQRVGGRGGCGEALGVSLRGTASSADLGCSSKYSSETLEG